MAVKEPSWAVWGSPGAVLGSSWAVLGLFWAVLGPSGVVLGSIREAPKLSKDPTRSPTAFKRPPTDPRG